LASERGRESFRTIAAVVRHAEGGARPVLGREALDWIQVDVRDWSMALKVAQFESKMKEATAGDEAWVVGAAKQDQLSVASLSPRNRRCQA
jgi:hypothetical protein